MLLAGDAMPTTAQPPLRPSFSLLRMRNVTVCLVGLGLGLGLGLACAWLGLGLGLACASVEVAKGASDGARHTRREAGAVCGRGKVCGERAQGRPIQGSWSVQ